MACLRYRPQCCLMIRSSFYVIHCIHCFDVYDFYLISSCQKPSSSCSHFCCMLMGFDSATRLLVFQMHWENFLASIYFLTNVVGLSLRIYLVRTSSPKDHMWRIQDKILLLRFVMYLVSSVSLVFLAVGVLSSC